MKKVVNIGCVAFAYTTRTVLFVCWATNAQIGLTIFEPFSVLLLANMALQHLLKVCLIMGRRYVTISTRIKYGATQMAQSCQQVAHRSRLYGNLKFLPIQVVAASSNVSSNIDDAEVESAVACARLSLPRLSCDSITELNPYPKPTDIAAMLTIRVGNS